MGGTETKHKWGSSMSQDSNDFSLKHSADFIRMILFSCKTLFLDFLTFPMAVVIETADCFPHYGQLPSTPRHGLGSFHHPRGEELLDLMVEPCPFLPLGCFLPGFVGRGCMGVDSSLPPLIPVGIGSSIEGFLPKMVAESACRFCVRVIHVWYRSMVVTPSDGALGMCRCVFHGQCLSVIAASFYLFQSEWCTPPRDKKQWGHWEKQL